MLLVVLSKKTPYRCCLDARTERVEQHKITFLRFTKRLLEDYLKRYAVLGNRAWLGNQLHIDWLTWMGAKWANCEGEFRWFGFVRKETPE